MASSDDWFDNFLGEDGRKSTLDSVMEIDLASAIAEGKRISASTSDKAYRKLTSHANVTSYSLLTGLHECPRRFQLEKLQANTEVLVDEDAPVNLDFAFGHAVGSGIQTYAATGSLVAAQFAAFLAWKAPWDAVKLNRAGKPQGKSLVDALIAVEKFQTFWARQFQDYEVVTLPNGRPAVELAFAVDFENGYYYFGHIDMLLRNKDDGKLAVFEGKTTAWAPNSASYGNSNQALGYAVVVDRVATEIGAPGSDYDVFYCVWSAAEEEFAMIPFNKSLRQRAEWIQDILLDHANISTYQRINFYPKRGESCVNRYGRECWWYGQCNMRTDSLFPVTVPPKLEMVEDVEAVDFKFTLSELIATQKERT